MWRSNVDKYTKVKGERDDNDDDDDDNDNAKIHKGFEIGVDNYFSFDSTEVDNVSTECQPSQGPNEIYTVTLDTADRYSKLDSLPRDILIKIVRYLQISDLISLENTSIALRDFILHYWKTFCDRCAITENVTPLCVAWPLNVQSLYSFDNAAWFCKDPVKKWRIAAMRSFLLETFCCVICGQHLKDRMSVDGIYFNHDVLLCFPDCYRIFTINVNAKVLAICENYGIGQNDLVLISSSYPVLLASDLITTLRQMGINDKEVLAEVRPYLGYSREIVQVYFDYVEKIRTLASLL